MTTEQNNNSTPSGGCDANCIHRRISAELDVWSILREGPDKTAAWNRLCSLLDRKIFQENSKNLDCGNMLPLSDQKSGVMPPHSKPPNRPQTPIPAPGVS